VPSICNKTFLGKIGATKTDVMFGSKTQFMMLFQFVLIARFSEFFS